MRLPSLTLACALLATPALATPALAGPILDRVRAAGIVHCAATIRPGLAFPAPDGEWHGLEVDICRAVAAAALGPAARFDMHAYTLQLTSYDSMRDGSDDLSFLTASETLYAGLLGQVLPGPPVFYSSIGLMVLDGSPARHAADLRTRRVCAEPGTAQERTLIAWFASRQIPIHFFMFQESDEMLDAFYAGRCEAIAHETTSLAAIALQAAEDGHPARLLPDTLSAVPVLAMTPRSDADWAAIVGWTVQTILRADSAASPAPGGGPQALPLAGKPLGLPNGWQAAATAAAGPYRDIYARNLGEASPLQLPRGLNATWPDGLFCPPYSD